MKKFRELAKESRVEDVGFNSNAARTLREKPNKEPMPKLKEKDEREYDYEGNMAKTQLKTIIRNAETIHDMLEDNENLPEWVQSKITLAKDYIVVAANYLQSEMDESSSAYDRINARFKKLSGRSMGDAAKEHGEEAKRLQKEIDAQKAENERRQAAMKKEEVELDEENKPTNPELWSRAVSMAKQKFDVYPSAYANGWAAKWYKSKGGGWRSVNEENYEVTVMHTTKDGEKGEHTHKIMSADDSRHAKNIALQKHDKMLKSKGVEIRGMGTTASKVLEQKEDLPFKADKPKKQSVIPGKYGAGYSMARQLARMAMQKQIEKTKKPMKEAEERGTEPFLKTSRKAEIVKDAAKKGQKSDKFESNPELSTTVTRNY